MKCEKAKELFSDFCEGSLQRAMMVSLESHVGECENCRSELDGLKRVWSALDAAPVIDPPANFRELVWEKIDNQEKQAAKPRTLKVALGWKSWFTRRSLALAAVVLILLVLAPFAIPGKYSPAGWWNIRDLFDKSPPKAWNVTALPASISPNDSQVLVVPLKIDSAPDVKASVSVVSGPAQLIDGSGSVTLKSNEATNISLRYASNSSGKQILLQVSWKQDDTVQSKVFTVTVP
jgi:hypothetical protein